MRRNRFKGRRVKEIEEAKNLKDRQQSIKYSEKVQANSIASKFSRDTKLIVDSFKEEVNKVSRQLGISKSGLFKNEEIQKTVKEPIVEPVSKPVPEPVQEVKNDYVKVAKTTRKSRKVRSNSMFKKKPVKIIVASLLLMSLLGGVISAIKDIPIKYNLTYELGDSVTFLSEDSNTFSYEENTEVTLLDESSLEIPENLIFDGWTLDGEKKSSRITNLVIDKDRTLFAMWKNITYEDEVVVNEIAYASANVDDPDLFVGETRVITAGVNGEEETVTKKKLIDGEFSELAGTTVTVIKEKTDEVIGVGTKPKPVAQAPKKTPTAAKNPPASSGSGTSKPPATAPQSESFKNCTELRKKYPKGVAEGHPAYEKKHDRDKDGWACEIKGNN